MRDTFTHLGLLKHMTVIVSSSCCFINARNAPYRPFCVFFSISHVVWQLIYLLTILTTMKMLLKLHKHVFRKKVKQAKNIHLRDITAQKKKRFSSFFLSWFPEKYLNVPETNQTMILSKMANCFATCDFFNRRGGARLCCWGVLLFLRVRPGHRQLFTREWGEVNSYGRRRRGGGRHKTIEWTYPHSGHKGLTWAMVRYNLFTTVT